MPYLGSQLARGFATTTKQSFSGDASTVAFTLTRNVGQATDLEVFVDNVQQEPTTAYGVSGTTLTFTAAPSTGTNNIYVIHRGGGSTGNLPPQDLGSKNYLFRGVISTPTDGTSNLRFGLNAGDAIESGGNENVTIGDEAGTALTTGDSNVFVGYKAGEDLTTGTDNTFVGTEAGKNTTDRNHNTAIGNQTLFTNINGAKNTAVGSGSLLLMNPSTDVDTFNVAVGFDAGGAITTGIKNVIIGGLAGDGAQTIDESVIIGYGAGTAVMTGHDNTIVGASAGAALTAGASNVAVGYSALKTEDGNGLNVAVGFKALEDQNAGADAHNVAVGFSAGLNLTTATFNTLVGGLAGGVGIITGNNNTAIGYRAGEDLTGGNENTLIGTLAGSSITTGKKAVLVGAEAGEVLVDGDNNVAIGYQALTSDTNGEKSVAVGTFALDAQNFSTLTDSHNTAVGHLAGSGITTGVQNTFLGSRAGDALQDADFNVAIGFEALTTDTLGSKSVAVGTFALKDQSSTTAVDQHNTAVGHGAGQNITTGIKNVVVGSQVASAQTTGFNNIAIGYEALNTNTVSGAHVAIGYEALNTFNTTSNSSQFNVAVGTQAGKLLQTGTYNTFLGPQAGFNVTTGSKNTIIGQFDGNNHSLDIRTASNYIVLSDGDGRPWAHTTGSGSGVWKFIGEGATAEGITGHYHEFGHDNNDTQMMIMKEHHGSFASVLLDLRCARSASTAYDFLQGRSSGTSDTEFRVRGDGAVTSDNGFDGSGADYAEYFEWADGNSDSQDRTGYTVVLDGEKIKLATSDDAAANVIGAVSVNPSVVGDSDILRWKQKYLKDDFGAYIYEDYDVEDDDGNTVVQQRRKLNPDYDEDNAYISREDRKEWATIGMMGKLRIRKGQPTGDRWIKMRDVSDTVEEWLVR